MSSTITRLPIPERVANGAAWLDVNVPDWLERIDTNRLEMEDDCNCILGQLFENFWRAPVTPARTYVPDYDGINRCADLGFVTYQSSSDWITPGQQAAEYEALEAEWMRLVQSRNSAAA